MDFNKTFVCACMHLAWCGRRHWTGIYWYHSLYQDCWKMFLSDQTLPHHNLPFTNVSFPHSDQVWCALWEDWHCEWGKAICNQIYSMDCNRPIISVEVSLLYIFDYFYLEISPIVHPLCNVIIVSSTHLSAVTIAPLVPPWTPSSLTMHP